MAALGKKLGDTRLRSPSGLPWQALGAKPQAQTNTKDLLRAAAAQRRLDVSRSDATLGRAEKKAGVEDARS